VASTAQTVEVTADALTLDTVTDTQSTILSEDVVQNLPNSGRDFTQLVGQTTGFAGVATGGGAYNFSVNGSRSNAVNWQIEGTDNNDLWWNIAAVNQTGIKPTLVSGDQTINGESASPKKRCANFARDLDKNGPIFRVGSM
jgi:hypothetical protein